MDQILNHINFLRNLTGNTGSVSLDLHSPLLPATAVMELKNPLKRNAMSPKMIVEFHQIVTNLQNKLNQRDADVCELVALVIHGSGTAFCAGFDLDAAKSAVDSGTTEQIGKAMSIVMSDALNRLSQLSLITVSLINGAAFGGGAEITTATDYRIMHFEAVVRFVHVRMGLTCAWSGTSRLMKLVSRQDALRILAACEKLTADRAKELGFCDLVVFDEDVVGAAAKLLYPFVFFQTEDGVERKQLPYPVQCVKRLISSNPTPDQEHEQFVQLWGARDNLEALHARRRHL